MELKLDVKTLVIGIALGAILAATLGANGVSADRADFGIALENKGLALVRTSDGAFYVIEAEKAAARRVEDETKGSRSKYLDFSSLSEGK
jgi:hypothetical protein